MLLVIVIKWKLRKKEEQFLVCNDYLGEFSGNKE